MKIRLTTEINDKRKVFNINPTLFIIAAVLLAALFAATVQRAWGFELTPVDAPLEDVVGRPIEFRSMESIDPPDPVDLDQLETDLLEHGWEPAKVHDIMQDLRSGQMRYNAMEDHWYGRD
jgi:hypothetical protein